jgi:GAF domain-containing protein
MSNDQIAPIFRIAVRPGDRFTCDGNFWVHVVAILGPYIVVEEYDLPCTVPDDARVRIFKNFDQFRAAYLVPGSDRYWIRYFDDDAPLHHLRATSAPDLIGSALPFSDCRQIGSEQLLQMFAEQALVATGASGAAIALAEEPGMVCRASCGLTAPQPGMLITDQSGTLAECLREDRVLRCDDAQTSDVPGLASFHKAGINSVLLVPLRDGTGLLAAFSDRPAAFGDRETAALSLMSETLSVLLAHGNTEAIPFRLPEIVPAIA